MDDTQSSHTYEYPIKQRQNNTYPDPMDAGKIPFPEIVPAFHTSIPLTFEINRTEFIRKYNTDAHIAHPPIDNNRFEAIATMDQTPSITNMQNTPLPCLVHSLFPPPDSPRQQARFPLKENTIHTCTSPEDLLKDTTWSFQVTPYTTTKPHLPFNFKRPHYTNPNPLTVFLIDKNARKNFDNTDTTKAIVAVAYIPQMPVPIPNEILTKFPRIHPIAQKKIASLIALQDLEIQESVIFSPIDFVASTDENGYRTKICFHVTFPSQQDQPNHWLYNNIANIQDFSDSDPESDPESDNGQDQANQQSTLPVVPEQQQDSTRFYTFPNGSKTKIHATEIINQNITVHCIAYSDLLITDNKNKEDDIELICFGHLPDEPVYHTVIDFPIELVKTDANFRSWIYSMPHIDANDREFY